jgi:hypothetical protein
MSNSTMQWKINSSSFSCENKVLTPLTYLARRTKLDEPATA